MVADPGLCATCRWTRRVESSRGSVFWRCGRADVDARFPRYPRLPVLACVGFEADASASDGGAAPRSDAILDA